MRISKVDCGSLADLHNMEVFGSAPLTNRNSTLLIATSWCAP